MMHVAVLSDIHGNVRALHAVLADVDGRGIDQVVNLGDCVYGPFDPRLVMDWLMSENITTVRGNEDRILADAAAGQPASRAAAFTVERLAADHLDWLSQLSMTRVEHGMLLMHGTPTDDTTYLLSVVRHGRLVERSKDEIDVLLSGCAERIMLCGHDHTSRVVRLSDGRIVINPGSVGCPAYTDDTSPHVVEAGTPHARYAIVRVGRTIDVEAIRVPYDWDAAAREVGQNGFPDWAYALRTGWTGTRGED